jgi:ribosomal peptide maturation radical SAM protein 1
MMRDRPATLLVSMPWISTSFPSLSIGLLVAAARRHGHTCRAWYPNLGFASTVGVDVYEWMANEAELFPLAEHLFAVDVFGADRLASDDFLEHFCGRTPASIASGIELSLDTLEGIRDCIVPAFLDACAEQLLAQPVDVIGFSCVFNQALPSLALAQRLKRERPELIVVFGGGLMHGAMGSAYAGAFADVVDHVCTGEGDEAFPRLLDALRDGDDLTRIPGMTCSGALGTPAPLIHDLDELPTPDFDDYFTERETLRLEGRTVGANHNLPYESARGCWWGEKHHCVFCGLNTEGMAFRAKSPERVVAELSELSRRYQATTFAAADNILVRRGYTTLLPRLAELGLDFRFFYEIKANVTRDEVAALWRAGVHWLVPGIESFADHSLELMRKGTITVQNIQLLKWLQEFGITPFYNILVGFPGETDDDFRQMLALLPKLYHLPAPSFGQGRANLAQVHRFSPFFNEPEALGLKNVRAAWWYRHIIPPDVLAGEAYGYFFERDIPAGSPLRRHWRKLNAACDAWRAHDVQYWAELGAGFVRVLRQQGNAQSTSASLTGDHARVFLLADSYTSRPKLRDELVALRPGAAHEMDAVVDDLVRLGLMVEIGDRIVSVIPLRRRRTMAQLKEWLTHWGREPTEQHPARMREELLALGS